MTTKPRETPIEDLIAEILRPAIDVRAPYAKQMIIALRKLFVESALLREEAPQWQPIETAPKDGTHILVYFGPNTGIYQVFWSEEPFGKGIGAWCVTDCKYEDRPLRGYRDSDVTHWMPLPAAPKGGEE